MKYFLIFFVLIFIMGFWPEHAASTSSSCDPRTVKCGNDCAVCSLRRDEFGKTTLIDDDRAVIDSGSDKVLAVREIQRYPRTGVKKMGKIMLNIFTVFFEQLEMLVYLSLYKLEVIYTTLIAPIMPS